MRNEKGITLIALILIIVVLLILAGISISLVVNNEANQVTIEPNNQINEESRVEAEYDMEGFNTVNEVQEALNEIDDDDLSNIIDENVVNTETTSNTVVNEENTVVEENVVQ